SIIPSLLDAHRDDPQMHQRLNELTWAAEIFAIISYIVGPASMMLYMRFDDEKSRLAFFVFMVLGFACAGLIFWLKRRKIDPDLAALKATTVIDDAEGGETQSSLAANSRHPSK